MYSSSGSRSEYIERYRAAVRQERFERSLLDFFPHRKPRTFQSPPLPLHFQVPSPHSSMHQPLKSKPSQHHKHLVKGMLTSRQDDGQQKRFLPLLKLVVRPEFKHSLLSKTANRPETRELSAWETDSDEGTRL